MSQNKRAVVIGIDGATFDVINPMIRNGELKNISKLMQEGSSGNLRSTLPPITHAAWSTFSTGKNPSKHGVLDFISPPYRNDTKSDFVFTNFNSIKCKTFWQILNDADIRIGIINLPMTYPPPVLNGFIISGIDTPNENTKFTYPDDLLDRLKHQGIRYRPDYVEFLRFKTGQSKYRVLKDVRNDYFDIEEERRKAILYLMKNEAWDFLVVVLSITDRLAHHFWRFHDPIDLDASGPFAESVRDSYRKVDEIIGEMLECLDKETPVMIMSDHGFGTYDKVFFVNNWLRENGFLKLKRFKLSRVRDFYRFILVKKSIAEILNMFRLSKLTKFLPEFLLTFRLSFFVPFPVSTPAKVDWRETQAYAGAHGIYINLKGRTPVGIINPGDEYERVRSQIAERINRAQDPDTKKKFIKKIFMKEEVFNGPYIYDAPDIYIETVGQNYLPSSNYYFLRSFKTKRFGNHKMEGILILYGDPIMKNHKILGARIEDCMPTLFYLLGHPIPKDMDGKILKEAISPEYFASHACFYSEEFAIDGRDDATVEKSTYTSEETEIIRNRLKSLGYID